MAFSALQGIIVTAEVKKDGLILCLFVSCVRGFNMNLILQWRCSWGARALNKYTCPLLISCLYIYKKNLKFWCKRYTLFSMEGDVLKSRSALIWSQLNLL